jgi:hypothetical protein
MDDEQNMHLILLSKINRSDSAVFTNTSYSTLIEKAFRHMTGKLKNNKFRQD